MPLPSDVRRRLSLACLRLPCAVASITRLSAGVAAALLLTVTTMHQRQPRSRIAHAPWPTWPRASRSWHHCDGPRPRRTHHRAAVPPRAVLPPKCPGHAGQQELGWETMAVGGNARGPAWPSARRLGEPQPSCHHGVDPVAADQHLCPESRAVSEVEDLGAAAVAVVDGHDPGGVADGARRQLRRQDLQQHVPPDAAELVPEVHFLRYLTRGR